VRLVSATHRDLEARVAEGAFREDLLARLGGFTFQLPPLRERREDLGLLTGVLLRRLTGARAQVPSLSAEAGTMLLRYSWRRNIRELERCLAHAVVLAGDGRIEVEHLPEAVRETKPARWAFSPDDQLHARLVGLLAESAGNVSHVADTLHTSRSQVHRWMKRFGIEPRRFRR
jgi:transcriptional regulator of acetoin/glycerol metabolism